MKVMRRLAISKVGDPPYLTESEPAHPGSARTTASFPCHTESSRCGSHLGCTNRVHDVFVAT